MNLRQAFEELQNLDPKNPGAWGDWIYWFFCALAALVILVAGWYFVISSTLDDLHREQRKEGSLKSEFESKQKKVAALDAYKTQLSQMQHDFGDMLKQLPSRSEVANLLNDISQARVAAGLDEELFQPLSEQPKDFYAIIPNRIVVTGSYSQMGRFVSTVAALPRIVTVDDVEIKPAGPGGGLRMSALAKTYRYLDASEQAPPKKPGGRR
ncbi:MAG: type 4a pilus biogenesis protein PilO [Gammaproteobacteria bacterium]|nr:type 4a pilus biogenesis protein PilO [Gammaproteobacteria bacterium]